MRVMTTRRRPRLRGFASEVKRNAKCKICGIETCTVTYATRFMNAFNFTQFTLAYVSSCVRSGVVAVIESACIPWENC